MLDYLDGIRTTSTFFIDFVFDEFSCRHVAAATLRSDCPRPSKPIFLFLFFETFAFFNCKMLDTLVKLIKTCFCTHLFWT